RDEINLCLRREFTDPRLQHISVTHVELNKDYSHAKVFWDTYDTGTRGDAKSAIDATSGRMRSLLATKMTVRHIPALHYCYNSQYEDESYITKLLEESSDQDEKE